MWTVAVAGSGVSIESGVSDGVYVDGYSDIAFVSRVWCNGKGIIRCRHRFHGWRRDSYRSVDSEVACVKPIDFFGESDRDVESDVFLNRPVF